jgi:arginine deiminase
VSAFAVQGFPEYGRLRKVLVHSPGDELSLVEPRTFKRHNFDDAIEPEEFKRQHQCFIDLLRAEGVDVTPLSNVLQHNRASLNSINRDPNFVYVRDTTTVTPTGYIRMRMKSQARSEEPRIVEEALTRMDIPKAMTITSPATMEGGDLIFLDEETLLLGIGNRTNRYALPQLMKRRIPRVIAVKLSPRVIHLDGTMMVIDRGLAVIHPPSLGRTASVFQEGKIVRHVRLLEFLRRLGMRLIEVTDYERRRRATNVVTLGPRKVIM